MKDWCQYLNSIFKQMPKKRNGKKPVTCYTDADENSLDWDWDADSYAAAVRDMLCSRGVRAFFDVRLRACSDIQDGESRSFPYANPSPFFDAPPF